MSCIGCVKILLEKLEKPLGSNSVSGTKTAWATGALAVILVVTIVIRELRYNVLALRNEFLKSLVRYVNAQ